MKAYLGNKDLSLNNNVSNTIIWKHSLYLESQLTNPNQEYMVADHVSNKIYKIKIIYVPLSKLKVHVVTAISDNGEINLLVKSTNVGTQHSTQEIVSKSRLYTFSD